MNTEEFIGINNRLIDQIDSLIASLEDIHNDVNRVSGGGLTVGACDLNVQGSVRDRHADQELARELVTCKRWDRTGAGNL